MQYERIADLLSMLGAKGIETSEIANGGTDKGEWVILENSQSCSEASLTSLKSEIADVLGLDGLTIESRGDGMVLRGNERVTKERSMPMSYADFFAKIGKKVVSSKPFDVSYLSHYFAPFTGGGSVAIPAGVVFVPQQKMRFDAMYCRVSDAKVVELAMRHERDVTDPRLSERLSGVSFYLTKHDFEVGNVREC